MRTLISTLLLPLALTSCGGSDSGVALDADPVHRARASAAVSVNEVTVTAITPAQGPVAGGTVVSITGSGFTPDTSISFNRAAAVNVQVLDGSHIQVTAPPLGTGPFATALAAVRVANSSGSSFGEFLYVPPTFDEIGIGEITTIAGVGNFVGEGRLAPQALVEAQAMAFDSAGRLYLGEETGGRVRRVEANGRIVTIAGTGAIGFSGDGGPAADAQFNWPVSVAVDGSGNVYLADSYGNNRIRRVDGGTGIVTTFAGTGSQSYSGDGGAAAQAALNVPSAVAVDGQGDVYVVDAGNQRIRKIAPSGLISTIAGNGIAGFAGDGGPATQASFQLFGQTGAMLAIDSGGLVYVVDFGNQRIRRIGLDGKVVTVVGGGAQPPSDAARATDVNSIFDNVVIDAQDRPLFTEGGSRIWRLEADGTLTRIAGTGVRGLTPDGAPALSAAVIPLNLAVAPNGDLYFGERSARRVRRIDAATGLLSTAAGIGPGAIGETGTAAVAAVFGDIGNIGLDATGNILAVEARGSLRIRRIDAGGRITTLAGIGVEAISGFYAEGMAAVDAGMSPVSVAANAGGDVIFTDFCALRRIGTDGVVRTIAGPLTRVQQCGFGGDGGPGTSALLGAEQDTVRLDAQGNMYIADLFNHRVRRVAAASGVITTFAGSGRAATVDGYDYAPEAFAGDGGPATDALLTTPTDVAFGPQGDVCIADTGNFSVRCVNAQGIIRTVAGRGSAVPGDGGPGTAASLNPYRIAFDAIGNLYISDIANANIRRVDVNGTITTVAGLYGQHGFSGDGGPAAQAALDYGSGLAIDAHGNILIFDGSNRRIRVIKQAATLGVGATAPAVTARAAGPITSQTVNVFMTPAADAINVSGSVFVAALLPPSIGGGLYFRSASGAWSPFADCDSAPAEFTGVLAPGLQLAVSPTPTDLSAYRDTSLYVGYGLGASIPAACNDMLGKSSYARAYAYSVN
jgi:sugar lactone lactonase YvrE